jgi:methylmalonyl-CoA/ethylmalonyl-CoA epimerase
MCPEENKTMRELCHANFFGEEARFDHIGFAVKSINKVYPNLPIIEDPLQKARIAFLEMNNTCIELVEPLDTASPVNNILEKGQKIYHICYQVNDLEQAVKIARKHGFHRISSAMPAAAFAQKRVVWLYNTRLGLVELLETGV